MADIGGPDFTPENADPGAIDTLYGVAGNGLPLAQLFVGVGDEAAQNGIDVMNAALATGTNPLTIANDLADTLDVSQARALTIARTEMLGAWRDAQSINFRANSDVLDGWIWSADLAGACIACVMMDGTVHTLDEDMDSHPNCECSQLPLTKSWDDLLGDIEGFDASDLPETDYLNQGYADGLHWFQQQDAAYQLEVLGPAKYEAWQSGDVTLLDFVGQKDAGVWGNEIYERSLKEIGLDANTYLGSTTVSEFTAETTTTAEAAAATEASVTAAEQGTAKILDISDQVMNDAMQQGYQSLTADIADRIGDNPDFQSVVDRVIAKDIYTPEIYALQVKEWEETGQAVVSMEEMQQRDAVSQILREYHNYAGASSSSSPLQVALQEAAKAEFGLTNAASVYTAEQLAAATQAYGDVMDGLQAFLRAMYENTQEKLAAEGISEATLYRGMRIAEGSSLADAFIFDGTVQSADVALQPLSSYSANLDQAYQYARADGVDGRNDGILIATTVSADQILSIPGTGFGAAYIAEAILLGGDLDSLVVPVNFAIADLIPSADGVAVALAKAAIAGE